ncbi:tryptophan synthase subunit alpha [Trichothermofontia sp.]
MTAISQRFATLRQQHQCALIPFITAGDPDLDTTAQALQRLDRHGADMIELGVPYSDPLADGPVIQAAATRALQRGTRLAQVLDVVRSVQPTLTAPIILFTYYNPILHRGIADFLTQVAQAGVAGLVIPDLPVEEAEPLLQAAEALGLEIILLVAPTSPLHRIQTITAKSHGFVYLVSVTGVTGMRSGLQTHVQDLIQTLRQTTDKPIGVGFGISQPDHAKQIRDWGADAVIVGSAFVQRLATGTPAEGLDAIADFCQRLKAAIV